MDLVRRSRYENRKEIVNARVAGDGGDLGGLLVLGLAVFGLYILFNKNFKLSRR